MKPSDIYSLEPINVSYCLYFKIMSSLESLYYDNGRKCTWFENLEDKFTAETEKIIESEKKLACKIYMYEESDSYGAMLFALFYDEKPFMVVKNYGKDMETYDNYLTDLSVLEEVKKYIDSFSLKTNNTFSIYNTDTDEKELDNIDSYLFEDYYQKNLILNYKEGDIVWAFIPLQYNYHKFIESDYFVLTRVKITNINKYNPTHSYDVFPIDLVYKWENRNFFINHDLTIQPTHPSYSGHFSICDELILGKNDSIITPDRNISLSTLEQYQTSDCFKEDPQSIFYYKNISAYKQSFLHYQNLSTSLEKKSINPPKLKV